MIVILLYKKGIVSDAVLKSVLKRVRELKKDFFVRLALRVSYISTTLFYFRKLAQKGIASKNCLLLMESGLTRVNLSRCFGCHKLKLSKSVVKEQKHDSFSGCTFWRHVSFSFLLRHKQVHAK